MEKEQTELTLEQKKVIHDVMELMYRHPIVHQLLDEYFKIPPTLIFLYLAEIDKNAKIKDYEK